MQGFRLARMAQVTSPWNQGWVQGLFREATWWRTRGMWHGS